MPFTGVLGQTQAKQILFRAANQSSLPHAYLFYGPESVGKKRIAIELAKWLNCEQEPSQDPCGQCSSCRKIDQGLHPDVFLLEPPQTAAAREGQYRIDQIRDLQKKLGFFPYEGKVKVVILDGAERINPQAGNAFLKTLEEPPAATLILLITAHPQQLLPTMVSRCQGIRFHPLAEDTIRSILRDQDPDSRWSEEELTARAARSGGQVQRALQADLEQTLQVRQELVDMIRHISFDRIDRVFAFAKAWARKAEGIPPMLDELAGLLRDLIFLQIQKDATILLNQDIKEELKSAVAVKSRAALLQMQDHVHQTRRALAGNINPQLALETLLLEFCEAS